MNDSKILEAMNTFYTYKRKYEESLLTKKKALMKNPNLTRKEKKDRYKTSKHSCIYCKKPVGTTFIESDRKLLAKCGAKKSDKYEPCAFNIEIQKGSVATIPWAINLYEDGKESDKDEIIKTKLDLFFNFENESDTLSIFNKIKKNYSEDNEEYENYLNDLIDATPYLKNKNLINEHNKIIIEKKTEIIELIKKSKNNKDKQFLKDAMEIYIKELLPMIEKDRSLKYSYFNLEDDMYDKNTKKLNQKEISISNTEFILDTDPEIINYYK